jgi:hypothetical protein
MIKYEGGAIMDEKEIREKVRIEEDEREKLEEEQTKTEGKGCFMFFLFMLAIGGIWKLVQWLFF